MYTDGTHLKPHIPPTFGMVTSFEFPIPTVTSAVVDVDFIICSVLEYRIKVYGQNNHVGCNEGPNSANYYSQ